MLFTPKKESSSKIHGFCQQIDLFLICFLLSKKSQKKTFLNILDSKDNFLDLKSKVLKTLKNRHFAKGLVYGVRQTIDLFLICFFFSKKSQNEKLFNILEKKEYLLDLKSETLAKSKQWTFCKGVSPWFLTKLRPSSYICFVEHTKQERNTF